MRFDLRLIAVMVFAWCSITLAAAGQHVLKYNDNKTPYPLYCGIWGTQPVYTDAEINLLATHVGLYAQGSDRGKTDPRYASLFYVGYWPA